MLLKQRGSGKPVGGSANGRSILGPARPPDHVLVAISKPPGLSVTGKPGELTLLSLLPDLSQKLGLPQDLQVIRAAGKESSGLVLLSSCPNTIRHVHNFYIQSRRARNPTATYCAITTRIPEASEGEICTGLKLMQVGDFNLVVPVASPSRNSLKRKEVKKTLTHYKVLDSHEGCALLQLQPLTATYRLSSAVASTSYPFSPQGRLERAQVVSNTILHLDAHYASGLLEPVQRLLCSLPPPPYVCLSVSLFLEVFHNQLLVHLTLILSPALGDHVYSSRVGTVLGEPFLLPAESTLPRIQVLEDSLLKKLHLQQQHIHRLQLHLHLYQLQLPATGAFPSNTVLTAPLPTFFLQTLSLLGLALPQEENKEPGKTLKAFSPTQ
ncbi:hypothetical protein JD844_013255 [Phrynosoma platyrhinos]|uniref:Pseudouridine synthase RsuA/RluA-like domain-containing protein n=1 Tax=Phrynosoma platyrhinos TaxID=52577 RepID=A0ABQ7TKJ0_PHRPL|nr:hypothetical protein JD844_013255 [Phrynosoma platyrhinos]